MLLKSGNLVTLVFCSQTSQTLPCPCSNGNRKHLMVNCNSLSWVICIFISKVRKLWKLASKLMLEKCLYFTVGKSVRTLIFNQIKTWLLYCCFCPAGLINTFSGYGPLTVEWPGKDGKHPRCPPKGNVAKGNCELVG